MQRKAGLEGLGAQSSWNQLLCAFFTDPMPAVEHEGLIQSYIKRIEKIVPFSTTATFYDIFKDNFNYM